jgi:phosphatidylglycerol lysyltransferase
MGRKTTFYQIGTATRDFLIQRGYYCFGVGQEAIIELASFGLDGPARANLRHTITRAQKGGLSARFYRTGIGGDEGLLQKLRLLDRAWQAQAGRPMGFTINAYDQDALRIFPVAVVFAAQEAVAFATFRPTNQAETCWVLDLMRRERHAEPGAMEWAIAQAATAFKTQGGEELSLGLAPLYGLSINQGPMAERLLALGARLVRRWYNINSLGFFKTKFAPRWEPRYGAVPSRRASLGFYLTLLRLHTRRTLLSPVARPPAQEVA